MYNFAKIVKELSNDKMEEIKIIKIKTSSYNN